MSREGNSRPINGFQYFEQRDTSHGKGTWLLVVGLALATAYSCSTDSDATNPSFTMFRKEYINLEDCLASNLAIDGLSAECEARDGSKWRIQQSNALVLASERALAKSAHEALEKSQERDTTLAWVSYNKPLILTPVDSATCDDSCIIVGQREDGTTEYFALTDAAAIYAINTSMVNTGLEPELAIIIDKNTTSY